MYQLKMCDESYNKFVFNFDSMEELSKFAEAVFNASANNSIELVITKEEKDVIREAD